MTIKAKETETKMSVEQIRLLNAVLLCRGRIDTSKNIIQLRTKDEKFAEWLADEFSNIGGRVVNIGDKVEFRTGRHDWVERWHDRWYYINIKIIPPKLSLSPLMGWVWFYERGSVHDVHGRVKLDMKGMRHSVPNARSMLKRAGFESFENYKNVEMTEGVGERFLEWVEKPPQCF